MDYRKFLGREEIVVGAFLGGAHLHTADRRVALHPPPAEPGWYRARVVGRRVVSVEAADAPPLEALPLVRGHLYRDRLIAVGSLAHALNLLPPEEPPLFSPVVARRWHSGDLLFDAIEFEGEAEEQARRALEDGASLQDVKGAPATLRAAFALAVADAASARLHIPCAPSELRPHLGRIADGGAAQAEAVLRALAEERALALRELEAQRRARHAALEAQQVRAAREARAEALRRRGGRGADDAATRAELALDAAGARLVRSRALGNGQLEVIFTFMDERFISVVDMATLQVVDSGICLGHPPRDDLVTLESLPSVIREAIETDQLVILRHG